MGGCNCGKNRTPATGFGRASTAAQDAQRAGAAAARAAEATSHTSPTGETTHYGSRLEASAAMRRQGGTINPS